MPKETKKKPNSVTTTGHTNTPAGDPPSRVSCDVSGCLANYKLSQDMARHKWSHVPSELLPTCPSPGCQHRYAGRTDAMKLHYDDKHPTEAYPANHRWPRLITVLKEHNVQLVGHMKVSPLPPPLPELKPEVQRTKWTLPKNPARTLLAAPLLTSPSTTISSMGPSTPQVQLTLPLNVDLLQGPETSTTMDAVGLLPPAEHIYMGLTLPSTSYLGNQTPYSSYSNNHSYPAIASNQYMMPSYYPTGANMMFYPGATGPIMANDLAIGQIDLGFLGLDTEPEALSLPNPAYSDPLFNGFQFQYNHI